MAGANGNIPCFKNHKSIPEIGWRLASNENPGVDVIALQYLSYRPRSANPADRTLGQGDWHNQNHTNATGRGESSAPEGDARPR